jgi:hypothetical protein
MAQICIRYGFVTLRNRGCSILAGPGYPGGYASPLAHRGATEPAKKSLGYQVTLSVEGVGDAGPFVPAGLNKRP